ncbi:MAG: autotransporter assembly complex family protein [Pseudomonadota bacterium]
MLALALAPVSLGEITIDGLSSDERANVRHSLSLAKADCDTPAWSLRRMTAGAPDEVRAALEPLGYYRATSDIRDTSSKSGCWKKTLTIVPGEPTRYGEAGVAVTGPGAEEAAFRNVLARTAVKPGEVVHHGRYRALKTSLQNTATQLGYFDARFETAEVVVREDLALADVALNFATGPRYRIGQVTVESDLIEKSLFDTLIDVRQDMPYNASNIAATHRNLQDSGYFAYENVRADPNEADGLEVPVVIEAAPAKTRVYTGGLGYATDVGPRFRLNYRNRRINRRGHTLNSQLLASPVQSVLGAEYRIPAGDDRRDVLSLAASVEEQDTDTSEFSSVELGVRRTHAQDSGWLRTLGLDLRREDFKVGTQDESSTLLIPSISWFRSTQAASARPASGYRLALDVRGAGEGLGSDTSFVQLELTARAIRSLGERWRVLTRARLGATSRESSDALPVSLRFFAGGDNSVRGYGFETIGPVDEDGIVIGGSMLATGSLELDYLLNDRWALAVFADTGSAFDSGSPDFKTGLGIGVRRLTPVGPLRIDLAAPLDLDRTVRLHFSIGSDL